MGGRGAHSRMGGGNGSGGTDLSSWHEAFDPGVDYERSGDVNHNSRTVSGMLQARWDQFTQSFQSGVSAADDRAMFKEWNARTNEVFGYFRTTNSMAINKALNDPANAGKTDDQIFTRPKDLQTIKALDKAVAGHTTQADAYYLRFCSAKSLQRAFGFSDADMKAISMVPRMNPAQVLQLNKQLAGSSSRSRSYTSTSANRSMNAFKKMYGFERRLYAPKGTNAYAPQRNAQESEMLFGRNLNTQFMGVSFENGHIVIHEMFDGYR